MHAETSRVAECMSTGIALDPTRSPAHSRAFLDNVTPLILTLNEEHNIARTLDRLKWANEIVVVDSGSTDRTLPTLKAYPNVRVVSRAFDTHATQWNFGLSEIRTEWVLALDADYEISSELEREMASLSPPGDVGGYEIGFIYRVFGHSLLGSIYPAHVSLFRAKQGRYWDEGHTQRIAVAGGIAPLSGKIFHDDRKPISRWFQSQIKYVSLEVDYLLSIPVGEMRLTQKLRYFGVPMPILVGVYILFAKGVVLNGLPGMYYTLQRMITEMMIALVILDRRLRCRERPQ
jgi:glycosyltransferase involved in cell wall biosynthesis